MRVAPMLSTGAAVAAVGLGALVVVGLARAQVPTEAGSASASSAASSATSIPAVPAQPGSPEPIVVGTGDSSGSRPGSLTAAPSSNRRGAPAAPQPAARTSHPASSVAATATMSAPAPARGQALPVGYATYSASQVITVVAGSTSSTTAVLQAWTKAAGGGWLREGAAMTAQVGSAGLTAHPSESLSATPIGSFSLTRAFGRDADPGTALPYHLTSPSDWWISQSGPLYNTLQTCSGSCPFTQGNPNEHLYYETPFYNYAVVINYNVSPVVAGAGSAFFLHVTNGTATAGCVAIAQPNLISIMRWLSPSAQPRILIGVS